VTTTPERIMAVALDLFSDRGYEATSMRDIAAALGLSAGAFYHHFPSKEAVLIAVCEPLVEGMGRFAAEAKATPDIGAAMLEPYLDVLLEHGRLLRLVAGDTAVFRVEDLGPPIRDAADTMQAALERSTGADPLVVGCAIGALHGGAQAYDAATDDILEARALILRSVQLLLKEAG
jgi:AcrR family transcriptional regulator